MRSYTARSAQCSNVLCSVLEGGGPVRCIKESGTRSSKRWAADLENACSLDLAPDLEGLMN
jgi:hypothetical protein